MNDENPFGFTYGEKNGFKYKIPNGDRMPYSFNVNISREDKSRGKLKKHYLTGVRDGLEWIKTASLEAIEQAAHRYTVNEALSTGKKFHPYDLHGYSPLMEGDYPEIDSYFEDVLDRESDFGFQWKKEYEKYSPYPEIPNAAFRKYEDGWTKSVREHWLNLIQSGKLMFVK